MLTKLAQNELSIGPTALNPGEEAVEILGYVGIDFVLIDFMVTATDWSQAAAMIRSAREYGVTPWIRLQSYPWAANGQVDPHLAADSLRALAIGAECVTATVNNPEQVAALLAPIDDWHRRPYLWQHLTDRTPRQIHYDEMESPPLIFPMIEGVDGVNNLEDILAVEGMQAVFLGLGDLSLEMGHPFEDRHPDVRKVVQDTVKLGKERNIHVFANVMAYASSDTDTPQYIAESIRWLWKAGVPVVCLPNPSFAAQRHFHRTLGLIDDIHFDPKP